MKIVRERVALGNWFRYVMAGVIVGLVTFISGSILVSANSEDETNLDGSQRIVTIFDGSQRLSVVTKANSVAEVLKQAEIEIDTFDVVEPALESEFDQTDYTVNVYRARPVLVEDGMQREWVMSPALSAREVAAEAALNNDLRVEDVVEFVDSSDTALNGVSSVVSVDRAKRVEVNLYGNPTTLYTQSDTIQELLDEKGFSLGEDDTMTIDLNASIVDGVQFEIWREGIQTVTEEHEVDFPVRTIRDADKEVGFKEVQTPGIKGKRSVTFEVLMKNGQEESRVEIQSVSVEEPQEEVVVVGAKPTVMPYTGGGTKTDWLSASSIPSDQWGYADWLVNKESTWNPNAVNKSSGACGLAQALPCSKVPGNPYDPVNSLNWMNSYVNGRYGSWAAAVEHSRLKGWY